MKRSIANTTCIGIRACGLPKSVSYHAINEVAKWVQCSGAEWAVARLKELKLMYIRTLSEDPYKPAWVSLHKNGTPKGAFKNVFKCKKPHKVISTLMVYTGFRSKKVTEKQFRKFDSSAEMVDFPRKWGEPEFRAFSLKQLERLTGMPVGVKRFWNPDRDRFSSIQKFLSRDIRVPSFSTSGSSKKTEQLSLESVVNSMSHPFFKWWLETRENVPQEYFEAYTSSPLVGNPILRFGHFAPVGRVSFIQEAGYKLRAVFNPLPCFQLALSALGTQLFNILKHIPEDCTFDQQKGVRDTQEALAKGLRISTLDLSDATNSFPMEVTMYVLQRLQKCSISPVDLELFEAVSTAPWLYPPNPMGKASVALNRGQPLGLYPSFAAFALSHHAIVRALKPKFYRILGDDIVIDSETAVKLRRVYGEIGVKLSESKCFESNTLAEFAGKIIHLKKVYNQPKHHKLNDRNFIDILRSLPLFERFALTRQRKVAGILKNVHVSDSPFGLATRYYDTDERPLLASYYISTLLAEQFAGNEPEDMTYVSPHGRLLRRLAMRVQLRHMRANVRNAFTGYHVEADIESNDVVTNSTESSLLEAAGITQVPSEEPIPGWVSEPEIPKGDPRPFTQLEVLLAKAAKRKFEEVIAEAEAKAKEPVEKPRFFIPRREDGEECKPEGPVETSLTSTNTVPEEQADNIVQPSKNEDLRTPTTRSSRVRRGFRL